MTATNASRIVLITGMSKGLGLSLARQLIKKGARVIGISRAAYSEIDITGIPESDYFQCDLSDPHAVIQTAQAILASVSQLDTLVHNAAAAYYGSTATQKNLSGLLKTNTLAPVLLTNALYPLLVAAKQPRVIFISSVHSRFPTHQFSTYSASKCALEGLARSLREEWRGKIGVQVLYPGPTATDMHQHAGMSPVEISRIKRAAPDVVANKIVQRMESSIVRDTALSFNGKVSRTAARLCAPFLDRKLNSKRDKSTAFKHALVTGGGSGIGKALCDNLTELGVDVCAIDRKFSTGDNTTTANRTWQQDITECNLVSNAKHLIEQPVDLVIHCAAINAVGRFEHVASGNHHDVLNVNFLAPLKITRDLIEQQLVTPNATHVFVASLSCLTGYPGAATYAASKDGLAAFARCLRGEVTAEGGSVLVVYPGPTDTPHATKYSPDNSRNAMRLTPESVASTIIKSAQQGRPTIVPGAANKGIRILATLVPGTVTKLMARWLLPKLDVSNATYLDGHTVPPASAMQPLTDPQTNQMRANQTIVRCATIPIKQATSTHQRADTKRCSP